MPVSYYHYSARWWKTREQRVKSRRILNLFSKIFWWAMLLGHAPLLVRAVYRLAQGIDPLDSLFSLLTLTFASVFFVLKLRGFNLLPSRPGWRQAVAFCMLGVFLHLLLFPPEVFGSANQMAILEFLTAPGFLLLFVLIFRRLFGSNLSAAWVKACELLYQVRVRSQNLVYLEAVQPALLLIPQTHLIHRGPPCKSRIGR